VIQIDPNDDPNVIQIVELIQNNPKISRAELAGRLQISERKTRMCIEQLKKDGVLIREGSTKRGKWIVLESTNYPNCT
jgi:predicted HTH transcriptional regulator